MKYKLAWLLLGMWMVHPVAAQEKAGEEKAKPSQTLESSPSSAGEEKAKAPKQRTITLGSSAEEDKPKTPKARGTPVGTVKGKAHPGDIRPDGAGGIPDRMPLPVKPERRIVITDVRDRKIELSDFHLGSAGFWEYDGLRIRRAEEKPLVQRPSPGPPARVRVKDLQKRLQERLSQKRVNRNGPEPRPTTLARDTVVKWDTIREADLVRSKSDRTLYARVITADNKKIEGPVNVSSDYLIGTRPNGRDFVIRLRNVKHIAFTGNPPEPKKRPAASAAKPRVNTVKWGDHSPKKLQSKPSSSE